MSLGEKNGIGKTCISFRRRYLRCFCNNFLGEETISPISTLYFTESVGTVEPYDCISAEE